MNRKRPSDRHTTQVKGAPAATAGRLGRIGAPALIALGSAIALVALLSCALLIPGFVLPASAETTSSTLVVPDSAGPDGDTRSAAASADPAVTAAVPDAGTKLVTLPWGAGAGQVGLAKPSEGLTRGPEALAVSPDGRIAILDAVNSRLVLLTKDGGGAGTVPLALREPRFLAVDDKTIYVLDADADQQVLSFDWAGTKLRSAQLPKLDDVVTGLFLTDAGPCVEIAHSDVFLVELKNSAGLKAAPQAAKGPGPSGASLRAVAGRPMDSGLGRAVKVTFEPKDGVKLKRMKVDKSSFESTQTQAVAPEFKTGKAIDHLVSVDGDGKGGVIIGAHLLRGKGDATGGPALIIGRLAAADTAAAPLLTDTITLTDSPFAYVGQPYVVAPDGRVLQPVASQQGYSLMVHSLPGLTPVASAPAVTAAVEVKP
jgi:hypothetical protein